MQKKVILALFSLLLFTMFSTTSAMAAVKFEIDNDSDTYKNSMTGNWQKLSPGNYGDSRIFYGSGSGEYWWIINPGDYNSSLNMMVYLNNSSFNNSKASYYANAQFICDLDQQYAPTWSRLYPSVAFQKNVDNYFSVSAKYSPSNRNTGADTVTFNY
ncbi:hypothetical protein [Bacillus sp. RS11]|uniref:hypothetical protein n=1 Tax=Lysinibacillus sp. RS11 TaxID=3242682 RepID=UPI0035C6EB5F